MLNGLWRPLQRAAKQRRGGWRQQLANDSESEVEEDFSISHVAGRALQKWADGKCSATDVRQACVDSQSDGGRHPMVLRIAAMPGDQHCHESLVDLLTRNTAVVDMLRPITDAGAADHILLPSSVISSLYQFHRHQFEERFGAEVHRVEAFWAKFLASGNNRRHVAEHSILSRVAPESLKYYIPLCLHEDAGPISKSMSGNLVSFSSLLGIGYTSKLASHAASV